MNKEVLLQAVPRYVEPSGRIKKCSTKQEFERSYSKITDKQWEEETGFGSR